MADFPDWSGGDAASYTKLFSGQYTTYPSGGLDVSSYGSVYVLLSNLAGTTPIYATYAFVDSATGLTFDVGELATDGLNSLGSGFAWCLPVMGGLLKLPSANASTVVTVIGVPIRMPRRMLGDLAPARQFQVTVPASSAALSVWNLPGIDPFGFGGYPAADMSGYNGNVHADVILTQGMSFNLIARWYQPDGSETTPVVVIGIAANTSNILIPHPFAFTRWAIQLGAVSPASPTTVTLNVYPAHPLGQ